MQRIRFLSLLCLFVILPLSIATAEMNVNWIRTGVLLEFSPDDDFEGSISVSTVSNGVAHKLTETPTVTEFDTQPNSNRILLQFPWQPNEVYQFHFRLSDTKITATAPLKPTPYAISTVELDTLLSLMENLRQPAKPTAMALGPWKNTLRT